MSRARPWAGLERTSASFPNYRTP